MATLSLRLWAQPHVEKKLGRCVLLDRSPGVVIAVDESGIVAVVLEASTATETNIASGSPPEPRPTLTLTRTAGALPTRAPRRARREGADTPEHSLLERRGASHRRALPVPAAFVHTLRWALVQRAAQRRRR